MNTTYGPEAGLRRTAAATAENDMLQGLSSVCLGVMVILAAALGSPILMAFGGVAAALIEGWYAKRYGQVKPTTRRVVVASAVSVVAVLAIVGGLMVDGWYPQPVLVSLLVTALVFAGGMWLGLRRVGLTRWHWVVFALVALASLLPLVGLRGSGMLNTVWGYVTGAALIVLGLIDHRRFREIFGPGLQQGDR